MKSNFFSIFLSTLILSLIFLSTSPVLCAFECPDANKIFPCECTNNTDWAPDHGNIFCSGGNVTQKDIDSALLAIHDFNGNPKTFHLNQLIIEGTQLVEIDLNTLAGLNADIEYLLLMNNYNWTNVTQFKSSTNKVTPKIRAHSVNIAFNNLIENEAIGTALTFLDQDTGPQILNLEGSKLNTVAAGSNKEIIPGISNFPHIKELSLSYNEISHIERGFLGPIPEGQQQQVPGLANLQNLNIALARLEKIGKGAFDLPGHQGDLFIDLSANQLNNGNFEEGFIPPGTEGNTTYFLGLDSNNFDHLSADLFEPLIYPRGPVQNIWLKDNFFTCDWRMKWLKDGREQYQDKILGVDCFNDKGNTIFNTTRDLTRPKGH